MKAERAQLPQYVCAQTVERYSRNSAEQEWRAVDTMQLDVAVVGDEELYGKAGSGQFFRRPLSEAVGSGVVSTGKFALLARQVLDTTAARYRYKGLGERDGATAHEYDFDVEQRSSNYRLRSGAVELPVAYQGTFWFKEDTLDLLRLELQAYDIPEKLGLAEAVTTLSYARVSTGDQMLLLPVSGSVMLVTLQGLESMNRMRISSCRRYQTQSEVRFAGAEEPAPASEAAPAQIPPGSMLELALDDALELEQIGPGLPVTARLLKELRDGGNVLMPSGVLCRGSVIHLEKQTSPYPILEVGLELTGCDVRGQAMEVNLTMVDAGPAAGLIRQQKRLDPVFTKRRTARMDILVRKVEQGLGYLHWDARKGPIPRGLKMKWRVVGEDDSKATSSQ